MRRATDLQDEVARFYEQRSYDAGARTLMLGVVEEVGELAQAILLTECDDFQPSRHKASGELGNLERHKDVAGEVADVIIYLMALCNRLDIKPDWRKVVPAFQNVDLMIGGDIE